MTLYCRCHNVDFGICDYLGSLMHSKKRILLLIIALALSGCASPQYQWGIYEHALYGYYKNPERLDKYAAELARIITIGEAANKVPPGIYAEYGYVLLIQGKRNEAIAYFEREKKAWPESIQLMDIMIKTATSP